MERNSKRGKNSHRAMVGKALFDKIILIIFIGAIFGGGASLYTKYTTTPVYDSVAQLYVYYKEGDVSNVNSGQITAKDYKTIIKSDAVLEQVIDELGFNCSVSYLRKNIDVTILPKSNILEIIATASDAKMAKNIVDCIVEVSKSKLVEILHAKSIEVISEGSLASEPISLNEVRNTIIGAIIGICLAVVMICIVALRDRKIKSEDDVEEYLNLNTLAVIPLCEEMNDNKKKVKMRERGKGKYAND